MTSELTESELECIRDDSIDIGREQDAEAMLESLVNRLAALQVAQQVEEESADRASKGIDDTIRLAREQLAELEEHRRILRQPNEIAIGEMDVEIETVKSQIIEAWDGASKTIETGSGTIKFRTTYSLRVGDGSRVLESLMSHLSTPEEIMEYIHGFNKTKLKAYIVVHALPTDVAGLVPKTTVRLEVPDKLQSEIDESRRQYESGDYKTIGELIDVEQFADGAREG
jgi:hypothetical protein